MPRALKNWWLFIGVLLTLSVVQFIWIWPNGLALIIYQLIALVILAFALVFYKSVEGNLGRAGSLVASLVGSLVLFVSLIFGLFVGSFSTSGLVCTSDSLGIEHCYEVSDDCWVPDLRDPYATPPIGQEPCPQIDVD